NTITYGYWGLPPQDLTFASASLIQNSVLPFIVNGNVTLLKGASWTHSQNSTTRSFIVNLNVSGNFDLQAGSTITVSGKGYAGATYAATGSGPVGGSYTSNGGGAGGGHGGSGGAPPGGGDPRAAQVLAGPSAGGGGGGSLSGGGGAGGGAGRRRGDLE